MNLWPRQIFRLPNENKDSGKFIIITFNFFYAYIFITFKLIQPLIFRLSSQKFLCPVGHRWGLLLTGLFLLNHFKSFQHKVARCFFSTFFPTLLSADSYECYRKKIRGRMRRVLLLPLLPVTVQARRTRRRKRKTNQAILLLGKVTWMKKKSRFNTAFLPLFLTHLNHHATITQSLL